MTRSGSLLSKFSAWVLCPLVLVVAVAAGVLRQMPVEALLPTAHFPMASEAIQASEGFAYVFRATPEMGPTEETNESRAVILEDGERLQRDSDHARIKTKGQGRFSHWGSWFWFASSDGTDPRTNGRAYEVIVPVPAAEAQSLARELRLILWCCAGAGLVLAMLARGRRPRPVLIAGSLSVLAMIAFDESTQAANRRWSSSLDDTAEALAAAAADDDLPAIRADSRDRSIRLLDILPEFAPKGQAPALREPTAWTFVPDESVDVRDGVARLAPGQSLVARGEAPFPTAQLSEIALRLRVLEGDAARISLRVDPLPEGREPPHFLLPLAAGSEWQLVRLARPLENDAYGHLYTHDQSTLGAIEIAAPLGGTDLVLETETVWLSDPLSVYSRATHEQGLVEIGRSQRPATWASAPGTFSIPLPRGATGSLRGSVGVVGLHEGTAVTIDVALRGPEGELVLHTDAVVTGAAWDDFEAALPDVASDGEHVVLLRASSLPRDSVVAWTGLRAVDTSRPARRSVLLLVDTLRADVLGSMGHPTNRTPTLDRLAAEGALFSRCYSQAYWTRPSMPSIMSGRYVHATGVNAMGLLLPESFETIAEAYAHAGYHTLAFVTNSQAGHASGLGQGLDEFVLDTMIRDTSQLMEMLVDPRLEALPDDDLFVWLHIMDVHGPYGPEQRPDDWSPVAQGTPVERMDELDRTWIEAPTVEDRIALYNYDLEAMDTALGSWIGRWLPRWESGDDEPVIIAVAADHGELLGEYGRWSHSWAQLVPEEVHVPLIVRAPGRIAPGTVWDSPVENIDLAATLFDASGVRPWHESDELADRGRSLLPLIDGSVPAEGRQSLAVSAIAIDSEPWGTMSVFSPDGALIGVNGLVAGTLRGTETSFRPAWSHERMADADLDPSTTFTAFWERYLASQLAVRQAHRANQAEAEVSVDAAGLEQMRALGYLGAKR